MEQKDVVIGGKYLHKDKKTIETVIYLGKVKINGKWHDSVVYKGIDYNTEKPCVFTRTLEDFCKNFDKLRGYYINNAINYEPTEYEDNIAILKTLCDMAGFDYEKNIKYK